MTDKNDGSPSAFWNINFHKLGHQETFLKKIKSSKGNSFILAQCDRPAIFYQNRDRLSMQYLNVLPGSLG